MTRRWQLIATLVAGIGLALSLVVFPVQPFDSQMMSLLADTGATIEDRPVGPLALRSPDGQTVDFAQFDGRLIYLSFWAEWCEVCKVELPALNAFAGDQRQRVEVITVAIDEDPTRSLRWLQEHLPAGINFHVYTDPGGEMVASRLGTTGVPETFLIDRQGSVVARYVGPEDFREPAHMALLNRLAR